MPRSAWLAITLSCALSSLLLLLESYEGYGTVAAAVGLSAAINLIP